MSAANGNRRRVSVEVEVHASTERNGGFWAGLAGLGLRGPSAHSYRSADDARCKKLAAALVECAKAAADAEQNGRRTMLGCGDGTVLLVEFRHGWGYQVAGGARPRSSAVLCGDGHDASLEAARAHAHQSYGGVAWECSL